MDLETTNIPFFLEPEQLPDELRIVLKLLKRIRPIPIASSTYKDFVDWLCDCTLKRNLHMYALLILCQYYCRQSFMIHNVKEFGQYIEDKIKANPKLLKMYKDL